MKNNNAVIEQKETSSQSRVRPSSKNIFQLARLFRRAVHRKTVSAKKLSLPNSHKDAPKTQGQRQWHQVRIAICNKAANLVILELAARNVNQKPFSDARHPRLRGLGTHSQN